MSKKIWVIILVALLVLVTGILFFKFNSSQSANWMGEDAAQFATGFDSRWYR